MGRYILECPPVEARGTRFYMRPYAIFSPSGAHVADVANYDAAETLVHLANATLERKLKLEERKVFERVTHERSREAGLRALAQKWRTEARESCPPEYVDRGLVDKYLRTDCYAGGQEDCADELDAFLAATEGDG